MRSLWLKTALLIAAVWLVAGGVMYWARSAKTTPESLMRYIEAHRPEGRAAGERAKLIDTVADQLNHLSYEERRELRVSRKLDGFFRVLEPDEQNRFLDGTLPTGFKQMMDSLNKMERPKRLQFVKRALEDMRKQEGEGRPADGGDDAHLQKIVNEGFKSFYSEASAETKMDVAPLIEQLQKNLQGL